MESVFQVFLVFSCTYFNNKFSKLQVLTHGLFSTMGQIRAHSNYYISSNWWHPISQFVLNSTTTRPSIFVQKKRRNIRRKRKKNTNLFYEEEKSPSKHLQQKKIEKKIEKKKKETFLELRRIPTYTIHFQQCVSFPKNILLLSSNKAWCSSG